jgi:hypothetical protein
MLADLCQQLEEGVNPDEAFQLAFSQTQLDLVEAIDRRKALMFAVQSNIEAARAARADLDAHIQRLKAVQEKVKDETKVTMEKDPELPYRDSAGRKLSLCNNSQASLKYPFEVKETRAFSNLVEEETIKFFDIAPEYLQTITIRVLDTDAIRKDLAEGKELAWVTAERGRHVRGWWPTKGKDNE